MKKESSELASNRRAYHDYEILETFEAGIALQGTEVKSLRNHGGNLQEGYVKILKGELWLIGTSIALYSFGNVHNHEEKRDRKLLLHKREILKIEKAIAEKGLTVIPLAFYMKEGKIKLKIVIAKGKKVHDKRQALLEREKSREMDRALKRYR
jgi:SsrA-binding protein